MSPKYTLLLGTCLAWTLSGVAQAQTPIAAAVAAQGQDTLVEEADIAAETGIVVRAQRMRGQLDVEQAPVLELNEEDILAVGANSVEELIAAIGPQTGSSRGRGGGPPVFLVNGIRISSFREMRSYPPESIAKIEVLPEEVAQRFGFPPDRRVVNMILKDSYSSREIELEFEGPDRGGYFRNEQQFTMLRIKDGGRLNVNLEAGDVSMLTEAERGVVQPGSLQPDVSGDPDPAKYRSLVADSRSFEATANWAKAFIESGSSLSFNGTYERSDSLNLSGLNTVLLVAPDDSSALRTFGERDPLQRRSSSDTFSTAATWTRPVGSFQLTATLDASHALSSVEIDRRFDTQDLIDAAAAGTLAIDAPLPDVADNGFDTAETKTWAGRGKFTARGAPLYLPAGEFSTTFDLGYEWDRIESSDTRTAFDTRLTRGDLEAGVNVVIPITSRRDMVWDALGTITLNAQAGINHLSDFGTLADWSTGINWSPWDNLNLQATHVWREVAPSLGNLGNPRVETFNVPVFDLANGETVLATVISGGNPDLLAETQRDWRFNASWELPFIKDTQFSAEYIRNRSRDVTGDLPALSAAVEAAFPDRVTRDVDGRLLSLDRRPVTYARTRGERLVFGLTTRGSIGTPAPRGGAPAGAGSPPSAPGGEMRRGGPPGGFAGGPPTEEQRARFMQFRERLCADDGMAFLDQVAGAIERGEDLTALFPDFDLTRAQGMLQRFKGEDGTIDRARLSEFRERICSMDPSQMRGGPGGPGGAPAGGAPAAAPAGRPQGGPMMGGRGGPGGFGGSSGQGRYFFNLTHTIELDNQIVIAEGGPVLDLLDGDAQGDFGQAKHSTRVEAGLFLDGKGLRLSGTYTGSARINGNSVTGTSPLYFDDLVRIDMRVFADIGRLTGTETGFLKGFTISMRADNLFDARRRVRDADGNTPLRYQPFLLDPTGRYLGVDLRKMF